MQQYQGLHPYGGPVVLRSAPEQIWAIVMFAVSAFALSRGGRVERLIAIANVLAWVATIIVQNRRNWVDPQWGVLLVDVLFLALLMWFALRSDRSWTLFAAAFQTLAVVTHTAILVDQGVRAWAYLSALIIWSYLVLAALGAGTWLYWREGRSGDRGRGA